MRVLLLGAGGFLGHRLAKALLDKGNLHLGQELSISQLVLADWKFTNDPPSDERVVVHTGDISDGAFLEILLDNKPNVIFHLAAIVSGQAEKDFEVGRRINLQATEALLEYCRQKQQAPIVVFASSCGVFGGDFGNTVNDRTHTTPQNSYGTQKAIAELLINDYSRRGWIDGRSLRLPTICVRPGKPNAATTSFVSGIIREPLAGRTENCPVTPETRVWVLSPRRVTDHFIHAAELPAASLGESRIITLPGLTTTIAEMVEALRQKAGDAAVSLISWEPDAFLQSIVLTFPHTFTTPRADALGFVADASFAEIINIYMEEELDLK